MRVDDTGEITIIGAGLAGTLLALLLTQRGHRVVLYERNPDPRTAGAPAGRSINLALAERGRHALRCAGLLEQVDRHTIPMRGRMLHDEQGALTLQPYGAHEDEVIYSVHRAQLNRQLLDAADRTGLIRCFFEHALEGIDWAERRVSFTTARGPVTHPFEVLIGADGGGSRVRRSMQDEAGIEVSEDLLEHGYKELTMPPAADGRFAMDPQALHIWPRGGFMMIALANADKSFTVTLFLSRGGEPGFDGLRDAQSQRAFMTSNFPDAVPLLTRLEEDFRDNPVGILGTVRCRQWHLGGRGLLIGDAAHAVVPFHGQGMNAAFEDCVALADALEDRERAWESVFRRIQAERRPNADAIADMALENYWIMRDAVRDPRFLVRKALEHELERRHPDRFVGRYSLVMFHRIPYAEAQRRGAVQAEILDRLMADADTLDEVDMEAAARQVAARLDPIEEPAPGVCPG